MKFIKYIFFYMIVICCLFIPVTTYAQVIDEYQINKMGFEEEAGVYSSDEIRYYYRVVDGVLQYRRWNLTRGYWIDATWLDMPSA